MEFEQQLYEITVCTNTGKTVTDILPYREFYKAMFKIFEDKDYHIEVDDTSNEDELFKKTCDFFIKNILTDFYKEYAKKRVIIGDAKYIRLLKLRLLLPLKGVFSEAEQPGILQQIAELLIGPAAR